MRKLLLLCTLFFLCSCSSQDIVEKNIETHMSTHLSEYEILSAEYSRLYISTFKDVNDVQSDLVTIEVRTALFVGHLLGLSAKSIHRKNFDSVLLIDRLAKECNVEAGTYLKLGFFNVRNRDKDVFPVGVGFVIDSVYNVQRALIIDDIKDYKYIYNRAFDKKQR